MFSFSFVLVFSVSASFQGEVWIVNTVNNVSANHFQPEYISEI